MPSSGRTAGIDVGVAGFLVTSDGGIITNPRFLDGLSTIRELQRRKGAGHAWLQQAKANQEAARAEWRKIRNQRQDFHHKTARSLVGAYDVIGLEELRIGNMTGSAAKGTVDTPGRTSPRRLDSTGGSSMQAGDNSRGSLPPRLKAPDGEWFSCSGRTWIDCHACGPGASDPVRTPSCARTMASWTPISTERATSPPGPGWALVKPSRLE